jgi:alkylation response protein AidB-like acyl-CoA dehydrogenase
MTEIASQPDVRSRTLPAAADVAAVVAQELSPRVGQIAAGEYPAAVLSALGAAGAFAAADMDVWTYERKRLEVIRTVARCCLATAFLVWCQTAAVAYVRTGTSDWLRTEILPQLETGRLFGGTGLSNAVKALAGLERLRLRAVAADGGFRLTGTLPAVSNLGPGHWFGVVAQTDCRRIAALVPTDAPGLELIPRDRFVALNGTATYAVRFGDVLVPDRWVLAADADAWLARIRPGFLLSQIGLGLGLADDVAAHVAHRLRRRPGITRWAARLERRRHGVEKALNAALAAPPASEAAWRQLVRLRRAAGRLALAAAETAVVAEGSAGYQAGSWASRRSREAWFVAILTPSLAQLELELAQGGRR